MPCYSEDIQNNNPLVKRIYTLKLGAGAKGAKDSTITNQNKKQAEEAVEQYMTRSSMSSSINVSASIIPAGEKKSAIDAIGELKRHPLFKFSSDRVAVIGPNIIPAPATFKVKYLKIFRKITLYQKT